MRSERPPTPSLASRLLTRLGQQRQQQDPQEPRPQPIHLQRLFPPVSGCVPCEPCDAGVEARDVQPVEVGSAAGGEGADAWGREREGAGECMHSG